MSENIVITNGINKPWELQGTNYDKPEEIVLANLAVGQLAFLGSAFGKYLSTQATVTAELADAVNRVRDRSSQVSSMFQDWATSIPQLDLTMPSGGAWPTAPTKVDLSNQERTVVDKIILANKLIEAYEVANKFVRPINPSDFGDYVYPCTYTFGPTAQGEMITGFSWRTKYKVGVDDFPDFQLYYKKGADGIFDETKPFVRFEGIEYEAKNFKLMWVPKSQEEIDYFNQQLSMVVPARNSRVLTDATQLVPVPSESSNASSVTEANMQQPAVTMKISIDKPDFIEFKLDKGGYYYYEKSLSEIPLYKTGDSLEKYAGLVVRTEDDKYKYVAFSFGRTGAKSELIAATPLPGFKNPTNLQQSEILSQYSDKVVRITQRSTEQTTYVNALTQRYNYFYEAATNILKAFTNLWSSLVSNI
jgi:hypothetical protein